MDWAFHRVPAGWQPPVMRPQPAHIPQPTLRRKKKQVTPNDIAGTDPAGAERNGQIRQDREMAEAKQVLDKRIEEMAAMSGAA